MQFMLEQQLKSANKFNAAYIDGDIGLGYPIANGVPLEYNKCPVPFIIHFSFPLEVAPNVNLFIFNKPSAQSWYINLTSTLEGVPSVAGL